MQPFRKNFRRKLLSFITYIAFLLLSQHIEAQISKELNDAINSVPIVSFAYPANRNRQNPPNVECPAAYLYAYRNLPYAIDLNPASDGVGGYTNLVIVKFNSVSISATREKEILKNAVLELQGLLNNQGYIARRLGFEARWNYSRSELNRIAADGRAIIAYREILTTQDLINKLLFKMKNL